MEDDLPDQSEKLFQLPVNLEEHHPATGHNDRVSSNKKLPTALPDLQQFPETGTVGGNFRLLKCAEMLSTLKSSWRGRRLAKAKAKVFIFTSRPFQPKAGLPGHITTLQGPL